MTNTCVCIRPFVSCERSVRWCVPKVLCLMSVIVCSEKMGV